MVFHSRFFGNAELEGCGLPMLPLIWFRKPLTASRRGKMTANSGLDFDQCHPLPSKLSTRGVTTTGTKLPLPCLQCFALGALPLTLAPPCWMHSVHFVDGQEVLNVLRNSSPLFHHSSCPHGTSQVALVFGGGGFCLGVLFCVLCGFPLLSQPGL